MPAAQGCAGSGQGRGLQEQVLDCSRKCFPLGAGRHWSPLPGKQWSALHRAVWRLSVAGSGPPQFCHLETLDQMVPGGAFQPGILGFHGAFIVGRERGWQHLQGHCLPWQ